MAIVSGSALDSRFYALAVRFFSQVAVEIPQDLGRASAVKTSQLYDSIHNMNDMTTPVRPLSCPSVAASLKQRV